MSKEKNRGNREAKKPKQKKPVAPVAGSSFLAKANPAPVSTGKKKR